MKSSTKYQKIAINLSLALATLLFCIYFLSGILKFFLPFIIGWLIAQIANPLVRFLEKKVKIVRKAGSAFVIILVLGIVCLAGYFIVSNLIEQIYGFVKTLPDTWKIMEQDLARVGDNLSSYFDKLPQDIQLKFLDVRDNFITYFTDFFSKYSEPTMTAAGNFAKNIPLAILCIIMTVMSAYFFVADREVIIVFVKMHTDERLQSRFQLVWGSLKQVVGGYFNAQLKIMIVVAFILFVGFSVLRVDYAILLAILIAFLDFLPFFGTGTVMLPWAIIRMMGGNFKSAIGLLIIWGISQLVRQVIQPKIVGDSMGMPALPTLILLYVGFRFGGAFGLIVAVPIGMIVVNLYKAGIFSNTIKSVRILIEDVNEFRKIDELPSNDQEIKK